MLQERMCFIDSIFYYRFGYFIRFAPFGTFEDKFESDSQTGRIKFKDKNKDTSGILGD